MSCRKLHRYPGLAQMAHRLWCPACRAARPVDPVIGRGVAQLQAEPASAEGLTKTLHALGLSSAREDLSAARHRVRVPTTARRMAAVIGLAALGAALALAFFRHTETPVFAETLAALQKVRSYHWTGIMAFDAQEQRWEVWYSPGHYREQIGDQITVDDGIHQRRYKAGTRVVIVDRSSLAGNSQMARLLQPGGLLGRIQSLARDQGWRMQVYRSMGRTRDGHPVEQYAIESIAPGKVDWTDAQKARMILRVDPDTKLPESWTVSELREGRWQLNGRVDQIDYNISPPAQLFDLKVPAGTRVVVVNHRQREQQQLAAQTTARGWKIILRALDLTLEGDALVTLSQLPPSHDRPQPDPVPLKELRDDRGRVYADTHHDQIAGTYTMFWLVSPVPPGANGPWPRRFTITVWVEDGETVIFRDIPAPPPAFESVLQLFPVGDADQVEKIQGAARTRRRLSSSGIGHGAGELRFDAQRQR